MLSNNAPQQIQEAGSLTQRAQIWRELGIDFIGNSSIGAAESGLAILHNLESRLHATEVAPN